MLDSLYVRLPEDIDKLEKLGLYTAAENKIKWLLKRNLSRDLRNRLKFELERLRRIRKDYSILEEEAIKKLKEEFPGISDEKIRNWIEKGLLDFIYIDGKRYFFNRFISNLLFLCNEEICIEKRKRNEQREEYKKPRETLKNHVLGLMTSGDEGYLSERVVRAGIKLVVRRDVLDPNDDVLRVWLPFPRFGDQQYDVKLIRAIPRDYILAPENSPQRTIYFELKLNNIKDDKITFLVEFEYKIKAFYKKINPSEIKPYNEESKLYQKYTSEQLPHIIFNRFMKRLAYEIIGDEENPYLKARKIYDWLTKNLTYTYVNEYSTYESISEFVARNLRGDCGFQALLFINLARIVGIPARWQSGWYANPAMKGPSPHDWAQFYIEPYGWLYVDLSFGRRWRQLDKRLWEFYFGNIDNFRTVFNVDIMSEFHPPKKYLRSDTVDNQRGEVETNIRNIYYDEFSYELYYLS